MVIKEPSNASLAEPMIAALVLLFGISVVDAAGAIYYVSQSDGNDSYDGLAASYDGTHGPWKTLTKASEPAYQQGDQLLLKCGNTWNDGLVLQGNGTAANPAIVSSYGTGNRPIIDRQDTLIANMAKCVYLNGNAYGWKIMNLDLANAARGVEAIASGTDRSFLWFENLYIHGCKFGGSFMQTSGDQNNMQIGLHLVGSGLDKATIGSCTFRDNFVGVTTAACADITDCLFEHMEWTGLWYIAARGGTISGNKFMHNCDRYVWCGVSASALAFTTGCLVEYNEFGETQVVGGAVDGEDLDFEAGCQSPTLRFNLFHESAGPASMLYFSADGTQPNYDVNIHDNVFFNAAANPSSSSYNGTFKLTDGNTGAITNNRIYYRTGVPIYIGSAPEVIKTGNTQGIIDTEVRGVNYALGATASASSNNGSATNVNDNNSATMWTGAAKTNQWVQLDFGAERMLDEFIVDQAAGSSISNFVLQYWDGARWKDIFTSYGLLGARKYMPTWTISTARVRLFITSTASGFPSIAEFNAYNTTIKGDPAMITNQPASQTVVVGSNVTFTVGVSGYTPLSYQWRFNGGNISGATASSYTKNNVQTTSTGSYSVVVTNVYGSATSANAVLTVHAPPVVTVQPANAFAGFGLSATFRVTATGDATLSYQWRFNGTNLADATTSTLTIATAQAANAGTYAVVVTNLYGTVTSSNALLTVLDPYITSQPQSRTNYLGSNVTFTVTATGAAPLSYQWRFNTTNIAGATDSACSRTNLQFGDRGAYSVAVSNAVSVAISLDAQLTVVAPPGSNYPPLLAPIDNRTVSAGSTVTFTNSAYDPNPSDTLAFSLEPGSPPSASIHPVTGVFTWTTATADTNSVHPITVRVTDSGSPPLSATASFSVTVITPPPPNQAPLLFPIANCSVNAGSTLVFTNLAFDPDGNTLTFSLGTGAPSDASIQPLSGVFSWTPQDAESNATKNITVRVTDDGVPPLSASATFGVTVLPRLPNHPPVLLPIADRTVHAGSVIVLTNSASDPDAADTLSFSLDEDAPTGADIDPVTGVFTWIPSDAEGNSTNSIMVWVTDDGEPPLSATAVFSVTIRPRPALQEVLISAGRATLAWSVIPGVTYQVEYKDDLDDPGWESLGPAVLANGPTATARDSELSGKSQRFYRVVIPGQ
jgi:hypothetical protein